MKNRIEIQTHMIEKKGTNEKVLVFEIINHEARMKKMIFQALTVKNDSITLLNTFTNEVK